MFIMFMAIIFFFRELFYYEKMYTLTKNNYRIGFIIKDFGNGSSRFNILNRQKNNWYTMV